MVKCNRSVGLHRDTQNRYDPLPLLHVFAQQ